MPNKPLGALLAVSLMWVAAPASAQETGAAQPAPEGPAPAEAAPAEQAAPPAEAPPPAEQQAPPAEAPPAQQAQPAQAQPAQEPQAPQENDGEVAGRSLGTSYVWGEQAEEASARSADDPGRVFAALSGGFSIRMIQHLDLSQQRFAPAYLELTGGYMFEGGTMLSEDLILRHGIGVSIATNLSGDGSARQGVDAAEQWVITPQYHAFLPVVEQWLVLHGIIGVPLAVSPVFSAGLELAFSAIFKWFAGMGAYAELDFSFYMGQGFTAHPLLSFEAGLMFDYELLP